MTNAANKWKKGRKRELINKLSPRKRGCQYPGCHEKHTDRLEFAHIRTTKLSRTGPRAPKDKLCDVNQNLSSYKVLCHKHHLRDAAAKRHDRKMRQLGRRKVIEKSH